MFIQVCGKTSCCFVVHLENSHTSFRPGNLDVFEGPASLSECYQYPVLYLHFAVLLLAYHETLLDSLIRR